LCILFIILSLFTYLGVLPFEFTLQTMHHLRLQYHWQCHALDLHVRIQRRCQSLHDFAGQSRIDECGLQLDLVFAGQVANIGDVVSDAFEKVLEIELSCLRGACFSVTSQSGIRSASKGHVRTSTQYTAKHKRNNTILTFSSSSMQIFSMPRQNISTSSSVAWHFFAVSTMSFPAACPSRLMSDPRTLTRFM